MIKAILFDKDGTLLKFTRAWVDSIIEFLEEKTIDEDKKKKLFKEIGIRENGRVKENSILSSETAMDLAIIFSESPFRFRAVARPDAKEIDVEV